MCYWDIRMVEDGGGLLKGANGTTSLQFRSFAEFEFDFGASSLDPGAPGKWSVIFMRFEEQNLVCPHISIEEDRVSSRFQALPTNKVGLHDFRETTELSR